MKRIFICGHRKSGTTLLASLLDNHIDLFVYPYETHFWYSFYPEYINKPEKEKLERIKNYIYDDLIKTVKEWTGYKIDKDLLFTGFCSLLEKTEKTTKDYFDCLVNAVKYTLNDGNTSIVTKDTHLELYANKIYGYYPDAKFINVIRDPRDNCASLMSGWDKHYKYQYDSKERLFRDFIDRAYLCQQVSLSNFEKYPNYQIIKYEDLVKETDLAMFDVKNFLGIRYSDSLLEPTILCKKWKGNSFDKKFNTISDSRIGIYKKYLTENQIKVIEYYFYELLDEFNYKPEFSYLDSSDAIAEHYKWFNHNQIYSGKKFRRYK
jgi:hypothetical protein